MIKAGEAGGSLEVILRRLAEFKERTQSLKEQSHRCDDVSDHGRLVHDRYFDIHHVEDYSGIPKDVQEFGIDLPAMTSC